MLDKKDFIGTDDIFITADTLHSNNFKEMVYVLQLHHYAQEMETSIFTFWKNV